MNYTHSSLYTKEILDPGIRTHRAWKNFRKHLGHPSYSSDGKPKPAMFRSFTLISGSLLPRLEPKQNPLVSWLKDSCSSIHSWNRTADSWRTTNTSHKWEVSASDSKAHWEEELIWGWGNYYHPQCYVPILWVSPCARCQSLPQVASLSLSAQNGHLITEDWLLSLFPF